MLELRKASLPDHDARHLSGWALQYDKQTDIGDFKETLAKGCIDNIDLNEVRLWINHKADLDVKPDNLVLELREEGLHFSCDVPDTMLGNWIMEEMENFTGMSFGFVCEDEVITTKGGSVERVITKIASLKEISLLHSINPAYKDTKICTRTKECVIEKRMEENYDHNLALAKEILATIS